MSTGKPRDAEKERFWRRVLRDCRRSGLSVRGYCEQHDLSEASLYAWRRTLAQRAADTVSLAAVRVVPDGNTLVTDSAAAVGLELVLANERRLRVGPGFDAPTLRRLLALLEEGRAC